jgi:AraC family transcriptional regulator
MNTSRFAPDALILSATSRMHHHDHPTGQLSLKTMSGGRAVYTLAGGRRIAVDDMGYLILNDNQPYTIEIDSPIALTSFCVFFPEGLADQVAHAIGASDAALLDAPDAIRPDTLRPAPHFFETLRPHDASITPLIRRMRAAFTQGGTEIGWMEEHLVALLARMLIGEGSVNRDAARLDVARMATRDELFRRLCIARDAMHASYDEHITLSDVAGIAALSPYHFLRAFKRAFGQTPHEYLTALRIERAQFLLYSTDLPITEICLSLGFTSLGSFSTLFRRSVGVSPRMYRTLNTARFNK